MTDQQSDYFVALENYDWALENRLNSADKEKYEVHLRKLLEIGYGNFDENLRRIRKFRDDYLNSVLDDYEKDRIKEEESKLQTKEWYFLYIKNLK